MTSESSTQPAVSADSFNYDAFLSYRSATDYQRARKIEAFLESFHKNANSTSVQIQQLRICRDGSDFRLPRLRHQLSGSTNPQAEDNDPIWQIIQSELAKARFLIVLCSPGAVNSTYMSKEICWFLKNRSKEQIIPVVMEGSDPRNRPQECFPADILKNKLHESVIWYDLRGISRFRRPAGVRDYEDEMVRLTADLLAWDSTANGPLSAIWQREQSRRRRRQSYVALIAAALFLAIGGYALVSARQKEQALHRNAQLQIEKQQALDLRDKEIVRREHEGREKDQAQNQRDKALAGEKAEAEKALKAAALAEERGIEAQKNGAEAKRQAQIAIENAKKVQANSLSTVANAVSDSLESALILKDMSPEILPTRGQSTARYLINSPLPYARYNQTGSSDNRLWSAAFTADGSHVLILPYFGEVKEWRADGIGEAVDVRGLLPPFLNAPDRNRPRIIVRYTDGSTVERPRPANDKQADPLTTRPLIATISSDRSRVATISNEGVLTVWLNQKINGEPQRQKDAGIFWSNALESQHTATGLNNGMDFVWRGELSGEPLNLYSLKQAESDPIRVATFSHDGSLLATGSKSGVVRIWFLNSMDAEPSIFQAHNGRITSISYSHDSKLLLTSSEDMTAKVWSSYNRDHPILLKGHRDSVARAAFSPDSRFVTTASDDGTVRLWLSAGRVDPVSSEMFYLNSPFQPEWFALSHDGSQVVIVSRNNVIRWYATDNLERLKLLREEHVQGTVLAISADGSQLGVLDDDKLLIYSLTGNFKARVLPLEKQQADVHGKGIFTQDGRLFLFNSSDLSVYIWNTEKPATPIRVRGGKYIEHVAISADRRYVAMTGEMDFKRGVTDIRVCDITSNKPCQILTRHTAGINKLVFSKVGHYLASTSNDQTACLWNVGRSDQCVQLQHHGRVLDADFSPDGSKLVTTAEDDSIRIWSTSNPKEQPFTRVVRQGNPAKQVKFSPDGNQILAIFNYRTELWPNQGTGEPIALFTENGLVQNAGFNSTGDRVFVYNSGDNIVRVYRTSWSALLEGFRSYLKICLPVSRRMELLGEAQFEAQSSYEKCEQSIKQDNGININN